MTQSNHLCNAWDPVLGILLRSQEFDPQEHRGRDEILNSQLLETFSRLDLGPNGWALVFSGDLSKGDTYVTNR